MIEMHFKAGNKKQIEKLNYALCEALVGSVSFQKGDEMFITSVEEIPEGYGFIAYFGAQNDAPILVFEDDSIVSLKPDGRKEKII